MITNRVKTWSYDEDLDPIWSKAYPELACAANSVSLLMPFVEPYVVRSARAQLDNLPSDLAGRVADYISQESSHHTEHFKFNRIVASKVKGLGPVLSLAEWSYGRLDSRSPEFGVAFSAGFETVAFAAARWVDQRLSQLFTASDDSAASLFLWHLSEEVEHKSVAYDLLKEVGVSRSKHVLASILSASMLAIFSVPLTLIMLWHARRLHHPLAHLRLAWWSYTFLLEFVPDLVVSFRRGHDPNDFVNPDGMLNWLANYDMANTLVTNSGESEKPSITSPLDKPESNLAVQ